MLEQSLQVLIIITSVLYNVIVLPKLSFNKLSLFQSPLVRGSIIVLIVLLGYYHPLLSLMASLSFILTHIKYYNERKRLDANN